MSDAPQTRTDSLTPPPNGRSAEVEALTAALAEARLKQTLLEQVIAHVPVGVFVADAKTGLPQWINQAGMDWLGRGLDPHRRQDEPAEVYPYYLPGTEQPYPVQELPMVRTMSTGEPAHAEIDILRREGRVRVSMTTTPMRDMAGRQVSVMAVIQPATHPPVMEASLHGSEETHTFLETVIEALPVGLFIKEAKELRFVRWNKAHEDLLGLTRDSVLGKNDYDFFPPEEAEWFIRKDREVLGGGQLVDLPAEKVQTTHRGERLLRTRKVPIVDAEGQPQYLLGISEDITERQQIEARLIRGQEQYRLALDGANDGIWDWDIHSNQVYFSPRWKAMVGYAETELTNGFADIEALLHPDDHDRVLEVVNAYLSGQLKVYDVEFRFRHKDGSYRWIRARGKALRDAAGAPYRMAGSHTDITDHKQAEAALAKRATELEVVAQVGTAAATILEPSQLLQTVVDLTKSNFKLYHAHVYILNETGDTLELAAGAGEVGHKMVSQGWRISLNREPSLVARAARTRQGLIVNDVREAQDFLPNPLLPDTRSEMALPIVAGDRMLGVLDVQSDELQHFSDADLRIQSILATQIAVALQNARQFADARRLADRETLVNAISQQIQSATTVESALQIAARELGRALGAQRTVVQLGNTGSTPNPSNSA